MSSRLQFILIGILGGFSFWGLFDQFSMLEAWRAGLPALVFAGAFFFGALAMVAELGMRRAVMFAAAIAAVASGLVALKGLGFESGRQMLATFHLVLAMVALATLPVPFAVAFGLGGRAGLTDYRVLFTESWNIVVRYVSAWLFVGTALLVLWLLSALLQLVGVTVLREVLSDDLGLWLITGATLGLGFSVVTELSDTVSPYLLLRMLRLLTPVVLGVVVIFIAALPLRGLSALFGELSAATALLATAIASVALISIVADEDDIEAAQGLILTGAARGLMALVPVLVGLAIWALALRVGQYGWTPERVAASALAGVMAGYGLSYLAALSMGWRWREKLRQANVTMALAILLLSVLWLSPLVSPEAISVRSQLARFAAGQATVTQLPLWEMAHDWGAAGQRGLTRLQAQADADLAKRLAQLTTAKSPWEFEKAVEEREETLEALHSAIALLPKGATWPEGLAKALAADLRMPGIARCRETQGDTADACVLVLVDLQPQVPGPEAVFLDAKGSYLIGGIRVFHAATADLWTTAEPLMIGKLDHDAIPQMIAALRAAPPVTAPVTLQTLQLGPVKIGILP